jgi:hypothetical protein
MTQYVLGPSAGQIVNEQGDAIAQFYGVDSDCAARRFVHAANNCAGISFYGLATEVVPEVVDLLRVVTQGGEPQYVQQRARALLERIDGV